MLKANKQDTLFYGNVIIIAGKYKGKIAYYDDDEDNFCLCYLGTPFMSKLVRVRPSSIENINVESIEVTRFKKENPIVVSVFGMN